MSSKKKQQTRQFSLDSPIITVGKQSNRSIQKNEKTLVESKLLPYTPPDALMFPLFSAIQRRAWLRARKLCHELILCDPMRKTYRDLYERIDQIIRVISQRSRPQPAVFPSRTNTANSSDTVDRKNIKKR